MNKLFESVGYLCVLLLLAVYGSFVGMKLIDWIAIPILNVRHYTMLEVYALMILKQSFFASTPSDKPIVELIISSTLQTSLALLIGYVIGMFL
jgi:hypothetical protein